ncbi:MAG: hypothetical protein ACRDTX_02820 [Pseudonocardiaceae bacterium]
MTNAANDVPASHSPAGLALSPGEALAELFLTNAYTGRNADNDTLVAELLRRRREIQALANPSGPGGGITTVG